MASTHPASAEHHSPLEWLPLIVMATALFIIVLDTTLLNVSLRAIIKDLHSNPQQIQWVITVYSLILAAFTITGGRLGDIFGRKRMFLTGAVIFAIGSSIAAASQSFGMILAGEAIIEGFGAALMMPATASLLLINYHGRQRAIAFAFWGATAGVAAAVGPLVGGYLTTNFSWRYGFLINVVVVALLLIASRVLPQDKDHRREMTIDWGGVALSAISLLIMVYGIIEASTYGWWQKKADFMVGNLNLQVGSLSITPIAIAVGVIGLLFFYLWELKVTRSKNTPLLTLDLFRNSPFVAGFSSLFAVSLALTGFAFLMPVFYQSVLNLDAFHSGLANLPLSIALLITAPLGAVFSKRILPKTLVIVGMLATAASIFWVGQEFSVHATAWSFTAPLALFGAGMGLVQSQVNNLALSAVPVQEAGEASGITNTMRQLGATLGSAVLGTILLAAIPVNLNQGVQASTIIPNQAKPAITQGLDAVGSNVEFAAPPSTVQNHTESPVLQNEVSRIVNQAISDADRRAAGFATVFVLLGTIVAFWLPRRPAMTRPQGEVPAGH